MISRVYVERVCVIGRVCAGASGCVICAGVVAPAVRMFSDNHQLNFGGVNMNYYEQLSTVGQEPCARDLRGGSGIVSVFLCEVHHFLSG